MPQTRNANNALNVNSITGQKGTQNPHTKPPIATPIKGAANRNFVNFGKNIPKQIAAPMLRNLIKRFGYLHAPVKGLVLSKLI